MKRKKPRDIVDRHVWRVARLAATIMSNDRQTLISTAVGMAIEILNEAQKQVDADVSKGAEELK